jgi:hypothetical protein
MEEYGIRMRVGVIKKKHPKDGLKQASIERLFLSFFPTGTIF